MGMTSEIVPDRSAVESLGKVGMIPYIQIVATYDQCKLSVNSQSPSPAKLSTTYSRLPSVSIQ